MEPQSQIPKQQPEQPTPPIESPTPPALTASTSQPQKSHLGLIIGIIIGIFVLIALAGVVYGVVNSANNKAKQLAAEQQETKNDQISNGKNSTTPKTGCVNANDLRDYFDLNVTTSDLEDTTYLNGMTIFFEADSSSVYSFPEQVPKDYDEFANFYTIYGAKTFNYHLRASTYESTTSNTGQKIAEERANKVKNELISRGVPADRIIIEEPTVSTYDPEAMRNVALDLRNSNACLKSNN